jgi:hypothetical protein
MTKYEAFSFIAVVIFALVHLFAPVAGRLSWASQGRFLSFGGGVAISYVFIDLLPKLGTSNSLVQRLLYGLFPYVERHVFIMALLGFLLFFSLDRIPSSNGRDGKLWLSIVSYTLFNFLVGYAVVDANNPEVKPLALFTFAMGLHYFTNDYSLNAAHGDDYRKVGRWVLIGSLFLGWLTGLVTELSQASIALVSAFIGGGVIMNVIRHELPADKPNSLGSFLVSAAAYTVLLLSLH